MAVTIQAARNGNALVPVTEYDREQLAGLKAGTSYKIEVKQQSNRSLQHHRLFFGGLLPFAFQYWQPTGGLLSQGEKKAVSGFAEMLDALSGESGFMPLADQYLKRLEQKRAENIAPPQCDIEHFRKWLIVEAGYFRIIETPAGIRKEAESVSFANMGQEAFEQFYRACCNVVWNMICSRHFDSEEAMQQAVYEFMELN